MRSRLILGFLALLLVATPVMAQDWMPIVSLLGRLANLPSGTVISYDSGDVTLTHSSNALTLAGGQLLVPDGTEGLPGIARSATGTTGLVFGAAAIDLSIAGAIVHHFTASGYGIAHQSGTLYFGTSYDASIARDAANSLTTGIWANLKPVQNIAGTGAITACKGHTVNVTAAGTATLPSGATVGQHCSVVSTTAAVVSIDVASGSDTMILNGTSLAAGNKATSDGTDEATMYCETSVANIWRCRTTLGIHTDGGA